MIRLIRQGQSVGLLALVLAAPAHAQLPADSFRLDLTEPQLVLSPGGRATRCDQLRFTRAGNQLLAVGDDKLVHTWDVNPVGLTYRTPMRWNVFRERRGAIYALALSPDERLVAVGGFGRKNADIALLDRTTGAIVRALSAESHPEYDGRGSVWCLAFNKTGDRVAIGLDDGTAWVWSPDRKELVSKVGELAEPDPSKRAAALADRSAKVIWVGFAGEAVRFARGDGAVFDGGPGIPVRELFRFSYPLHAIAGPADGRWLAGRPLVQDKTATRIELRGLPAGGLIAAIEFRDRGKGENELFPTSFAVDAEGRRMAVGSERPKGAHFSLPPRGEVAIFDLSAGQPVVTAIEQFDDTQGKPATAPDAIAFHPTIPNRLAIAGEFDHETGVWEIAGTGLRRVGEPSLGVGRSVWQVGAAGDGNLLCFRQAPAPSPSSPNDRGQGHWRTFDLGRLSWLTPGQEPVEVAVATQNGWRVEFDPVSDFVWRVVHPDGFRYVLPIDKAEDDRPTSFTFLPAGDDGKVRLAVGCYWGFIVYEFEKGTAPRRVAKGVGHQGYVTSIAAARGGRMLVTGSNDQTLCVWTLRPWDHVPTLGAAFDWQFDPAAQVRRFVVTAVQEGSPAWEAGLLKGDRIVKLGYNQAWIEKEFDWRNTIADAEPDRELAFLIDRPAGDKVVHTGAKTRLLTRPQVRFFPTAGYDWVMYRYADFYYSYGGNGDAYLGWLLGGKTAADTPEFHPADRFRDIFYNPGKVRDSVREFVREPDRPLTREYLPPRIDVAATGTDPVKLEVTVTPRADVRGRSVRLERVELWLDDEVLLKSWPGVDGVFKTNEPVPAGHLRPGRNRLNVVAFAMTRAEKSVEIIHRTPDPRPARVRALVVGVNTYPYLAEPLQLHACVNDASLVADAFKSLGRSGAFREVTVAALPNAKATPQAIFSAVDELAKSIEPDDWLIVFLAGHGFADPAAHGYVTGSWFFGAFAKGDGRRLEPEQFVGRGADLIATVRKTGSAVTGKELLDRLAKVNCRKLVLIDSCHSGAIAQDPGRDLRPDGKGAVVITAAAPDETASEFEPEFNLGGKQVQRPQGYFAYAIYNALTGDVKATDRNGDGLITLEELHLAVARGVGIARRANGLDDTGTTRQTVLAYPPALRDVVFASVRRPPERR
jgi:WD40 repeat protein